MELRDLVKNKSTLIAQKKAIMKKGAGIGFSSASGSEVVIKEELDNDDIRVKAVINTTNVIDSHMDLHVNGIWNKTLKEAKNVMYLQEHEMKFSKVIADGSDVVAYVQDTTFEQLGFSDLSGQTQALTFNVTISKDRNPFMYKQFKNGNVRENSVGMRYIDLLLAVNDEEYEEEKAVWDKYYPVIVNKEIADAEQYFWVVKQAALIEGSAVVKGSNTYTPVEVSKQKDIKSEEPFSDTLSKLKSIVKPEVGPLSEFINHLNL